MWIVITLLLAGWLLAYLLNGKDRSVALVRLVLLLAASLVIAYFVVEGSEPKHMNRFFLVLALCLALQEAWRIRRTAREVPRQVTQPK